MKFPEVAVTVTTLVKAKSLLAIDLLTIIDKDSPLLARLIEDPVLLITAAAAVCSGRA